MKPEDLRQKKNPLDKYKHIVVTAAGPQQTDYELSPLMTNIVENELNLLMNKIYESFPKEITNEAEKVVYNKYKGQVGAALRNTIGLNITKRLLNVHDRLLVKLTFSHTPSGKDLDKFIIHYKLTNFKKVTHLGNTYVADLKCYNDLDNLCSVKNLCCGKIVVTVKPCIPFMKCPQNLKTVFKSSYIQTEPKQTDTHSENILKPNTKVNQENTELETEVTIKDDNKTKNTQVDKVKAIDSKESNVKPKSQEVTKGTTQNKPQETPKVTEKSQASNKVSENTKASNTQTQEAVKTPTKPETIPKPKTTPAKTEETPKLKTIPIKTEDATKVITTFIKTEKTTPTKTEETPKAKATPVKTEATATKTKTEETKAKTTAPKIDETKVKTIPTATITKIEETNAKTTAPKTNVNKVKTEATTTITKTVSDKPKTTTTNTKTITTKPESIPKTTPTKSEEIPKPKTNETAKVTTTVTKTDTTKAKATPRKTESASNVTTPSKIESKVSKTLDTPKTNSITQDNKLKTQNKVNKTATKSKETLPKPQAKQVNTTKTKTEVKKTTVTKKEIVNKNKDINKKVPERKKRESDFDELDDQDILAMLSGGIILDECSGSDDD